MRRIFQAIKNRLGKRQKTRRSNPPFALRLFEDKPVSRKQLENFWEHELDAKKPSKSLVPRHPFRSRAVAVTPTVLGTVKTFPTKTSAIAYVENGKKLEQIIRAQPRSHFDLQPVQILDQKGNRVLERVYPGPNAYYFEKTESPYFDFLARRLKRKKIDLSNLKQFVMVQQAVIDASAELQTMLERAGERGFRPFPDRHASNMVVLDFDPRTSRVLLAFVDKFRRD